ncbi:MAG TPA: hypothetical protein VK391_00590, partial [Allosphingosinicella sp.]|nr:hypothetical protein [Allosphingosinicella sp.]
MLDRTDGSAKTSGITVNEDATLTSRPPLAFLLLATACAAPQQEGAVSPAVPTAAISAAAAADPAEDGRLLAFLDQAFDESLARSPQALTGLGIKRRYGELDDYTDAAVLRQQELSEAQLRRMKAEFDYERLSPAAQLSYKLFEQAVERSRRNM